MKIDLEQMFIELHDAVTLGADMIDNYTRQTMDFNPEWSAGYNAMRDARLKYFKLAMALKAKQTLDPVQQLNIPLVRRTLRAVHDHLRNINSYLGSAGQDLSNEWLHEKVKSALVPVEELLRTAPFAHTDVPRKELRLDIATLIVQTHYWSCNGQPPDRHKALGSIVDVNELIIFCNSGEAHRFDKIVLINQASCECGHPRSHHILTGCMCKKNGLPCQCKEFKPDHTAYEALFQ